MQVTLASRRSPDATSNEDFIAATASAVVVVDGASVPLELGTGCGHGTAWFARQLGTHLLALLSTKPDRSPADSLAQAITEVAALHADTCDLGHAGSPSATVAILREQP
jgi:predicted O-methyltransferase YrrM